MKRLFYSFLFTICFLAAAWGSDYKYTANSVLETGRWVKLQVSETGIYKLTTSDLRSMGFSDLNTVAVYGYGGWPLV